MHKSLMSSKFGQMRPPRFQWENGVITFSRTFLIEYISYLQVKIYIHKSLNEFEIRRDPTMDYGVGCP